MYKKLFVCSIYYDIMILCNVDDCLSLEKSVVGT